MTTYRDLGIKPVINASATLTRLGGSLMPAPVLEAMAEAAHCFIDLPLLQEGVGARIAELTDNEACCVTSGAAAGLLLATVACVAGDAPAALARFPQLDGLRDEVIVQRAQRNGYDYAIIQAGVRLVEVGPRPEELEAALSPRTACVVFFAGAHFAADALSLRTVIALAHENGVPVVVDAAAQIPPISNLWHFTRELGADLAIFSGGKGLRGPQSTGLVLGRADLVAACVAHSNPRHGIGRPLKVGKEELLGILAAVEWSLAQDEAALLARYEATVAGWVAGLADLPGVTAWRGYPSEAGQHHPRALVQLGPGCPLTCDQVVDLLLAGDPAIAVGRAGDAIIALNPQTVEPGEEAIILATLRSLLTAG